MTPSLIQAREAHRRLTGHYPDTSLRSQGIIYALTSLGYYPYQVREAVQSQCSESMGIDRDVDRSIKEDIKGTIYAKSLVCH